MFDGAGGGDGGSLGGGGGWVAGGSAAVAPRPGVRGRGSHRSPLAPTTSASDAISRGCWRCAKWDVPVAGGFLV